MDGWGERGEGEGRGGELCNTSIRTDWELCVEGGFEVGLTGDTVILLIELVPC